MIKRTLLPVSFVLGLKQTIVENAQDIIVLWNELATACSNHGHADDK
jgi:hypothetical protein